MRKLHTFGCSITQGHALPDIVNPVLDEHTGQPLGDDELESQGISWEDIHLYQASDLAWPQLVAAELGVPVHNHARRGACFNQIARQVAEHGNTIQRGDAVIVMWTYMSRLSIQWPQRTSVPLATVAEPSWGYISRILPGFNRLFGISNLRDDQELEDTQAWVRDSVERVHLDPRGVYDRYYRNLTLQIMTDGYLRATGARVIHLSVEAESALAQLERAQRDLDDELGARYTKIPDPRDWYKLDIDYNCAPVIFHPEIPLAPNDMHPSEHHHILFANYVYDTYFREN